MPVPELSTKPRMPAARYRSISCSSRPWSGFPFVSKGVLIARLMPVKEKSFISLQFVRFVFIQVKPDGLELRVLVVGVLGVIASTETRLLEATERRRDVAFAKRVHRHGTCPKRACGTQCALSVTGKHGSRKTVV